MEEAARVKERVKDDSQNYWEGGGSHSGSGQVCVCVCVCVCVVGVVLHFKSSIICKMTGCHQHSACRLLDDAQQHAKSGEHLPHGAQAVAVAANPQRAEHYGPGESKSPFLEA